jgi:hypothetical protein
MKQKVSNSINRICFKHLAGNALRIMLNGWRLVRNLKWIARLDYSDYTKWSRALLRREFQVFEQVQLCHLQYWFLVASIIKFEKTSSLSTNAHYTADQTSTKLTMRRNSTSARKLRKNKMPLKIKIFLWLAFQDRLQTGTELKQKKWKGCSNSVLCGNLRISTMFFSVCLGKLRMVLHQRIIGVG